MLRRIFIGLVFLLSTSCFIFAFDVPNPGGNLLPIEFPSIPHISLPSFEPGDSFLITYGFGNRAYKPGVAYNNGKFLVGWFELDDNSAGAKAAYFKYLDQEGGSISSITKLADIESVCSGCISHYMPYSMQVIPYEDDFLIGWVQTFEVDGRNKATFYYTNGNNFYENIPYFFYDFSINNYMYCGIYSDMNVVNWDDKIFMFVKEGCWYNDSSNKERLDFSLIMKRIEPHERIDIKSSGGLMSEVYDYASSRNFAASKSNKTIFLWQDEEHYLNVWLYPNEVNFKSSIFFNDYKYLDLDCTQEKCLGVADSIGVIIDDSNLGIFPAFIIDNNIFHGAKVKSGEDVFLVVWVYSNKIYGKFITITPDGDGEALGDTFQISDKSLYTWHGYDIAYDPENNRFLIVYEVWDNDRSNIFGKFISVPKQDLHLNVQGGKVSLQDFDGNQVNCENQECDFKVLGNSNLTLRAESGQVEWGGDCSICNNNSECEIYINKVTNCSVTITSEGSTGGGISLPLPTQTEAYSYETISEPIIDSIASNCKPFGVGDILQGKVRLKVKLPKFDGPVDVYVAIWAPSISSDIILLIDSQNKLVSVSLNDENWLEELPKWKEANQEEAQIDINNSVFGLEDIDLYSLPDGEYYFYVLVQPAGTQGIGDKYYLWGTSFVK